MEALLPSDFAGAAALLADAFFDNPAHVYLFPEEETRRERLRWLLERNLRVHRSIGQSFAVVEKQGSRRVLAMGFWHPPGARPVSRWSMLRHGMLWMPLRVGRAGAERALEVGEAIERERRRAVAGRPHWFLNNMVVTQERRGTGMGGALLGEQLRLHVDPSGAPAALATQRPENVRFYERLGFRVASEQQMGTDGPPFPNWIMLREARA